MLRIEVYEGIVEMAKRHNRSVSNMIDHHMEKVLNELNKNFPKER